MKSNTMSILVLIVAILVLIGGFSLFLWIRDETGEEAQENTIEEEEEEEEEEETPEPTAAPTPEPEPTPNPYPLATDFLFTDRSGNEYRLSDFYGKPIVINFFATWCGPCMNEMPGINELSLQYQDQVNFLIINLTSSESISPEEVFTFLSNNGYSFPLYFDTLDQGTTAYNIDAIPLSVFISEDGHVVGTNVGSLEKDQMQELIEKLINGQSF